MSRTTKRAAQELPELKSLILCLCIGSLLAHVTADGLKQPGYSRATMNLNHHHVNDGEDHEESLCLASADGLQSTHPINCSGLRMQPMDFSHAILPKFPPPRA